MIMEIFRNLSGMILSFFFTLLPTATMDVDRLVETIEKEHAINLENYKVINAEGDWLDFDLQQKLILELDSQNLEEISDKFSNDSNYTKSEENNVLNFTTSNEDSWETFKIDLQENIIEYSYLGD